MSTWAPRSPPVHERLSFSAWQVIARESIPTQLLPGAHGGKETVCTAYETTGPFVRGLQELTALKARIAWPTPFVPTASILKPGGSDQLDRQRTHQTSERPG